MSFTASEIKSLTKLEPEVVLAVIVLFGKNQRRRRTLWVHPAMSNQLRTGAFYILINELQEDSGKFFNYFKISFKLFEKLFSVLKNSFSGRDSNMCRSISTRFYPKVPEI
jgi:hypothetical protein